MDGVSGIGVLESLALESGESLKWFRVLGFRSLGFGV